MSTMEVITHVDNMFTINRVEKATPELRIKGGRLQQKFNCDEFCKETGYFKVYNKWRFIEEVAEDAEDIEIIGSSEHIESGIIEYNEELPDENKNS